MAGHGRPRVDDPRDKGHRVRMNNDEMDRLIRVSKDLGMSKSDTLRKLVEDYEKQHMKK